MKMIRRTKPAAAPCAERRNMNRNRNGGLRSRLALLAALVLFFARGTCLSGAESLNAAGIINRPISVDPTGRNEGYTAVLYNNPNGLPTSDANTIAETGEGFIWIGSYAGLIRYDGNTFERIDSTTGIANVRSLYVDGQDRLWIGTNDSGLFLMDKGSLRQWDQAEGLRASSVRSLAEDADGTLYAGSASGIAMIGSDLTLRNLEDERTDTADIKEMRRGNDGVIYGLTTAGDIFTLKEGKIDLFLSHENISFGTIVALLPDPVNPGYLYLAADDARVLYGPMRDGFIPETTVDVSPLSYAENMEYIDGQIWICSGNGIGKLDREGFHLLDNLPMNNSVNNVITDYEGNLWFTSSRQGVMKIVPNQFSDLFDRCGLPAEVVNSTCMLDGRLFIATDSGLIVIDRDGKKLETLPLTGAVTASGKELEAEDLISFLAGVRIRSLIRDSKGRLWIATWRRHGLLVYDQGKILAFTPEDGLLSDQVRTVCECADGRIAAAGAGGVNIIEGDRITGGYGEEDALGITSILTVTEGFNGDLILGSDGGGLYIINDQGVRTISKKDGLKSDVIMRIRRSLSREVYWIVTSNSLAYLTPDYQVHTIRQFPYSNNFDLYENSKGDIWVLSSNGIYVSTTEELLANGEISPVFYGIPNGLPYVATANSFSDLTEDGDLYIASSQGVVKVNIETPFEDVSELKAAVPFVDVDGTRLYPDEAGNFTIPSDARKLTVSSFVFNYSPTNPLVSYHLDGFDSKVSTLDRSDLVPVDYTNLRGGDYRFVMQIRDSMGRGNKEMSVVIRKEKAFYEEPWFVIFCALAFIGLMALLFRLYTRRKMQALEKKNRETKAFVREITQAFAKVIDMKDQYTNGHSTRVAEYTAMLSRELGYDEDTVERYYQIALLHDIGKIGIPPEVLNKAGKLTDEEFETIKSHTSKGYDALKEISIMPELAVGAQAHHERPDGKGYPNHLKAGEIPRVAQIIAVADCFDAMYSNRPYRKRMNFDKVVSIIQEVSGTQLTGDVVEAFMRLVARGEFRAPDDHGGGTMENIDNIRKAQDEQAAEKQAAEKPAAEKQVQDQQAAEKQGPEKQAAETRDPEKQSPEKPDMENPVREKPQS